MALFDLIQYQNRKRYNRFTDYSLCEYTQTWEVHKQGFVHKQTWDHIWLRILQTYLGLHDIGTQTPGLLRLQTWGFTQVHVRTLWKEVELLSVSSCSLFTTQRRAETGKIDTRQHLEGSTLWCLGHLKLKSRSEAQLELFFSRKQYSANKII